MTAWVQPYGPPTCLVVDGESSLTSDEAGVALSRQGCARMLCARLLNMHRWLKGDKSSFAFSCTKLMLSLGLRSWKYPSSID
eukprot:6039135-Lingulodinium_polyedra.AAC.1